MKPVKIHQGSIVLPRIFMVLAAVLLVGALAVATLAPPDLTLAEGLQAQWPNLPSQLQASFRAVLGGIFWRDLAEPLLGRPAWLLPASAGFIFVGAAISTTISPPRQSRRKRS